MPKDKTNIPFPRVENQPVFAVQRPGGPVGPLPWADLSRRNAIIAVSVLLAVIIVAVVLGAVYNERSQTAANLFGDAMQTYQTTLAVPGQPPLPGTKTFPSIAERGKAAEAQFANIANHYGMTEDGKTARYFQGLAQIDEGQTASAEATLNKVANSWDHSLASLASLALADLYRQTGRDQQAIGIYNRLAQHPTSTVPAATAQISLAELYTTEGKTAQAREIYAKLKDKDKDAKGQPGVASTIADSKLNPQPTTPAAPPQ